MQAENVQSVEAIGSITSSSLVGYEDVLPRLDDEDIQSLDSKLQMNAYAMKAVAPRHVSLTDYQNPYAKDFADAALDLKNAADEATPDLPDDMVFYVYYQRWRVLQNWHIIISSLWDGRDYFSEASIKIRDQAYADTKKALDGVEIREEIKNQKAKISNGRRLRRYIEFKENQ